jgi:N-acylneuraminate cytidylyltransferase
MKYTAFVFARGGSKGVPGKNLREINGKSLLQRAIHAAQDTPEIERVIVSTDSEEIALEAKKSGAEVPFIRPAELATDESPELLSWRHALLELERLEGEIPTALVSVPTTAPLRLPEDISGCIRVFQATEADLALITSIAGHNPYFNMVELGEDEPLKVPMLSANASARRQDAPVVHEITTVAYVARSQYVLNCESLFDGKVHQFESPSERAIDVDTELDLKIASILLGERETRIDSE